MANPEVLLTVDGSVDHPFAWSIADLEALPEADHVIDVSRFQPGRRGDGVTLESLLRQSKPRPEATYITLHANRDDFHVSVPLNALRDQAIIVYKVGDEPLVVADGGPIRLLIREPSACQAAELDECTNVKYLSRIELTVGRGRDTRPKDDAEHEALHRNQT